MSEEERAAPAPLAAPVGPRLRAAREARGLAVADVAGHLKIGPKKVEAIEAGDWRSLLPVPYLRGFVRNYARVVQLDAALLLADLDRELGKDAALPGADSTPSAQPLSMPFSERRGGLGGRGLQRWLVVVVLLLVLAAVAWAFSAGLLRGNRPAAPAEVPGMPPTPLPGSEPVPAVPGNTAPGVPDGSPGVSGNAPAAPGAAPGTALPAPPAAGSGPGASGNAPPAAPAPAPVPGGTPTPGGPAPKAPVPGEGRVTQPLPSPIGGAAGVNPPQSRPVAAVVPAPAAPGNAVPSGAAGAATAGAPRVLLLRFTEESWTEVRAGDGRVLLSQLNRAGTEQRLAGRGPFELVIGNPGGVRLQQDGASVDLAPHTRQNVARVRLP